jgi:hypothetical protein
LPGQAIQGKVNNPHTSFAEFPVKLVARRKTLWEGILKVRHDGYFSGSSILVLGCLAFILRNSSQRM